MRLNGQVLGITPSANVANCVLEGTSSTVARLHEAGGSGGTTTSTAMQTRLARDSAVGTGSRTAGNVQRLDQTTATPGNALFFSTTYATTQPTIVAGAIYGASWNANGGIWRWLTSPDELILLIGAASIEIRQDSGTATSSYNIIWEEL